MQAAREVEARLNAALSCLPVVVVALDGVGRVRWADGAGLDWLGLPARRLIGRSGARFLRRRGQPPVDVSALVPEAPQQTELRIGARRFRCQVSALGAAGARLGALAVAVDLEHAAPFAIPVQSAKTT
jgi:PAS domain-containing protein